MLHDALKNKTGWFQKLRRKGEGFRDILTHSNYYMHVSPYGTSTPGSKIEWKMEAQLFREAALPGGPTRVLHLLPALLECVGGACAFMEGLTRSVNALTGYSREDALILIGNDSDVVGCWPAIDGAFTSFPLSDVVTAPDVHP